MHLLSNCWNILPFPIHLLRSFVFWIFIFWQVCLLFLSFLLIGRHILRWRKKLLRLSRLILYTDLGPWDRSAINLKHIGDCCERQKFSKGFNISGYSQIVAINSKSKSQSWHSVCLFDHYWAKFHITESFWELEPWSWASI